jgi:hypothetical protein
LGDWRGDEWDLRIISLSSVFISRHYSDYNKVVIEKVGEEIEKNTVL